MRLGFRVLSWFQEEPAVDGGKLAPLTNYPKGTAITILGVYTGVVQDFIIHPQKYTPSMSM